MEVLGPNQAQLHQDPDGPADPEPVKELRRAYHDRIAAIRERSLEILHLAAEGTAVATAALIDSVEGRSVPVEVEMAARIAAEVDSEVVSLLALESPVARDLRVILAARDVTQIAVLCVGLCNTLARRAGSAQRLLTADLCSLVGCVGEGTAGLLRRAEAAWTTLDLDEAEAVVTGAGPVRSDHLDFFAALLRLTDVPMDAALDLGMTARAYERLTDHAVEIADRVEFAIGARSVPTPR